MAPHAPKVVAPDYKNIPHSHRLPVTDRDVVRTFNKLSRASLISLAQQWLMKKNRDFCPPFLYGDENEDVEQDDLMYEPAHSHEELLEIYKDLAQRKGGRKEVMDRILEGDWRNGISMYQLATAEIQHMLDHPTALRWTAKRLAKKPSTETTIQDMEVTNDSEHLPRFQAQTFMANLARELTPLMKAHYLITRIKTMPITILRVYIHDSPYSTEASLATESAQSSDSTKSVLFIWPNGSPFVWVSLATHLGQVVGDDSRNLRDLVTEAIPKAFSRSSSRYQLQNTNFTARALSVLLAYRGPGKSNAAAGGWSIFADASLSQNTLDFITTSRTDDSDKITHTNSLAPASKPGPGRPKRVIEETESPEVKRRKDIAQGRFGSSAKPDDGIGLDRFEVRIDDAFPKIANASGNLDHAMDDANNADPSSGQVRRGRPSLLDRSAEEQAEVTASNDNNEIWIPDVRCTFSGTHVIAGVRQLVEAGVVDGEKMPGWMTGEVGVTVGVVKYGRIRTKGKVPGV